MDDKDQPFTSSPLDIHIDRLTQQTGGSVPPEMRKKKSDRRQDDQGPPDGMEDRRKGDRRTNRLSMARERYLDMVLRERSMLVQQGITKSAEQLLSMTGAGSDQEASAEGVRSNATGDQLRAILPVQAWLPLNIHLVSMEEGVLKIAPLNELSEKQLTNLKSTANRQPQWFSG